MAVLEIYLENEKESPDFNYLHTRIKENPVLKMSGEQNSKINEESYKK
jgi:hypothetical protein